MLFKKVYPMSKKPVDFKDNPFRLVEVSRSGSFPKKTGFRYTDEDLEDLMDEELDVGANPIYGTAGYEDDDEDFEDSVNYTDDDDDDDESWGSDDEDDDNYQSFGSMDAASTDWGSVDFSSVDWGNY